MRPELRYKHLTQHAHPCASVKTHTAYCEQLREREPRIKIQRTTLSNPSATFSRTSRYTKTHTTVVAFCRKRTPYRKPNSLQGCPNALSRKENSSSGDRRRMWPGLHCCDQNPSRRTDEGARARLGTKSPFPFAAHKTVSERRCITLYQAKVG